MKKKSMNLLIKPSFKDKLKAGIKKAGSSLYESGKKKLKEASDDREYYNKYKKKIQREEKLKAIKQNVRDRYSAKSELLESSKESKELWTSKKKNDLWLK